MADDAIYAAAGMALVPFGDDDDPTYFEWHHCYNNPNCPGATSPCACSGAPWPSEAVRAAIDAAVAALAEAGRLLPEGGEIQPVWAVHWVSDGTDRFQFCEQEQQCLSAARLFPDGEAITGPSRIWPDGTMLLGPWQPVDTEGGLPYTMTRPIDSEALGEDTCEAVEMLPVDTEGDDRA